MDTNIYIYEVNISGEQQRVLSLLTNEEVAQKGLHPSAVLGLLKQNEAVTQLTPDAFAVNRHFLTLLHQTVAQHAPTMPELQESAQREKEGWVCLIDARTENPDAEELPVEDIIGVFAVKEGRLVDDSYRPCDKHLIFSERGLFRLPTFLHEKLMETMRHL